MRNAAKETIAFSVAVVGAPFLWSVMAGRTLDFTRDAFMVAVTVGVLWLILRLFKK